ncbi:MAG: hypothetical protein ACYCW6_08410 [Candidatus Xenobia bacterium]
MEATLLATHEGFLCNIACRGQVESCRVIGRDGLWYLYISVDGRKVEVSLPSREGRTATGPGELPPVPPRLLVHTRDHDAFVVPVTPDQVPQFMPYAVPGRRD